MLGGMVTADTACQEHICFDVLLKATPHEEGGLRYVYVEASKETRDQQGEVVLTKALQDSADVFRKFGVVDLDHKSMPAVARKYDIDHPEEWIIGQPVEVNFRNGTTFVKAQLRQGDTPLATRANRVWEGLTQVISPDRYYASVGGAVLERTARIDPATHDKVQVITKTRWDNLALSLQPVHPDLQPASTVPMGVFAKSLGGFVLGKALEASYATNVASLSGGGALGAQSLDTTPHAYFEFRDRLANALRFREIRAHARDLTGWAIQQFGLSPADAARWVERFLSDVSAHRGGMKS
jgi:hypothetical protein